MNLYLVPNSQRIDSHRVALPSPTGRGVPGLLLLIILTLGIPAAHAQKIVPFDKNNRIPIPAGPGFSQPAVNQPANACAAWSDDFNTGQLDPRWVVATGQAPGYIANQHIGYFIPSNVSLADHVLSLQLNQQSGQVGTNLNGVISNGAMIQTSVACGYGAYEWKMRMSSTAICQSCSGIPVSGSVSAGFNYVNNSQTEIDYEFTATDPGNLWLVNWLNPTPKKDPTGAEETATEVSLPDVSDQFHDYRFVWSAGKIDYYIDGDLVVSHTTNVPSAPAYFMITHWGADSPNWGGLATLGTPRYFYVTRASYNPDTQTSVTSLSPSRATAGGSAFTLTVNGSNFVSNSVVLWNGSSRTTTFVSSGQLTASIFAADIASPGTASVTVSNSGTISNAGYFTITQSIFGVLGHAPGFGVSGVASGAAGIGVLGQAAATSGNTVGVTGLVQSSGGFAGVFDNTAGGNLLIGAVNGVNKFRVGGTGGIFGAAYSTGGADFAESLAVAGERTHYEPGDVLVIDPTGVRRLTLAQEPYSRLAAGIYSTQPGVLASPYVMDDPRLSGEVPLAVVGIVPCKVSAENGPIKEGDMLVTSSIPGHAMKGTDWSRMLGAVVGKALEPLPEGTGVIEVLVTLQ